MPWKIDGAVERSGIFDARKDLAEGAGRKGPLIAKGYFQRFPHLTATVQGFAILGLGAIVFMAGSLLWHAPRCTGPRPSDVCPIGGVSHGDNTSVKTKGE